MLKEIVLASYQTTMPHSEQPDTQMTTIKDPAHHNGNRDARKYTASYKFAACLGVRMHDWHTVGGTFLLHLITFIRVSAEQTGKPNKATSSPSTTRRSINALHYNRPTSRPRQSAQPSTFWLSAHEAWSTGMWFRSNAILLRKL